MDINITVNITIFYNYVEAVGLKLSNTKSDIPGRENVCAHRNYDAMIEIVVLVLFNLNLCSP